MKGDTLTICALPIHRAKCHTASVDRLQNTIGTLGLGTTPTASRQFDNVSIGRASADGADLRCAVRPSLSDFGSWGPARLGAALWHSWHPGTLANYD